VEKLKDEDFPKFKLFLKGGDSKKPISYAGAATRDAMSAWLVEHTNLFIGLKVGRGVGGLSFRGGRSCVQALHQSTGRLQSQRKNELYSKHPPTTFSKPHRNNHHQ
jgi:hypothetical protein